MHTVSKASALIPPSILFLKNDDSKIYLLLKSLHFPPPTKSHNQIFQAPTLILKT